MTGEFVAVVDVAAGAAGESRRMDVVAVGWLDAVGVAAVAAVVAAA